MCQGISASIIPVQPAPEPELGCITVAAHLRAVFLDRLREAYGRD
jgi:hypothetical protein